MTTQADMMLMRALTMFGSGIGQGLDRRRQRKQNEEFADMIAPMSEPEDYMNPQDTQLIQALSGAVPGVAGMVSGAGMQGNQMLGAKAASGMQNQQAQQLRAAMKDPQIAAMMKQGYAQAQLSKMTPKEGKAPISLPNGYASFWDTKTNQYGDPVRLPKGMDPTERFDTMNVGDETWVVDWFAPNDPNTGMPKVVAKGKKNDVKIITEGVPGDDDARRQTVLVNGERAVEGNPYYSRQTVTTLDPSKMTRATTSKAESDIFDISNKMGRLTQLEEMEFDPTWLQIEGRLKNKGLEYIDYSKALTAGADKVFGKETMDDVWQDYDDWNNFARASYDNLNQTILEITGAQMNQEEVPRIKGQIPNVDDPPKKFWSKYNGVKDYLKKLDSRVKGFRAKGIVPAGVRDPQKYGVNQFGQPISYEEIAMKSGPEVAYQAWAADQIASGAMGEYADNYTMDDGELSAGLSLSTGGGS